VQIRGPAPTETTTKMIEMPFDGASDYGIRCASQARASNDDDVNWPWPATAAKRLANDALHAIAVDCSGQRLASDGETESRWHRVGGVRARKPRGDGEASVGAA